MNRRLARLSLSNPATRAKAWKKHLRTASGHNAWKQGLAPSPADAGFFITLLNNISRPNKKGA
jgi:hypothetical protein